MLCTKMRSAPLLQSRKLSQFTYLHTDRRQSSGHSAGVCTCGLRGRSLETSVATSAGRNLTVQLRSSGASASQSASQSMSQSASRAPRQASSAVSEVASNIQQAGNVEGAMLEPSVANKNWVRVLAISAAILLAARLSPSYLPAKNVAFLHLLAFSTFVGTNIWTTFIAGFTMFKALPRQTFGKLQAQLFPKYFALLSAACVICMGTIAFSPGAALPRSQAISLGITASSWMLGVGLATTVANWLYVEPMNTKLMNERYVLENAKGTRDEAKIKQMRKEFGKWHGASSVLNLAGLCGVMAHGWWLSSKIAFVPV